MKSERLSDLATSVVSELNKIRSLQRTDLLRAYSEAILLLAGETSSKTDREKVKIVTEILSPKIRDTKDYENTY